MKYISTRGNSESRTFIQAVTEGLARDGGLLVPETIPNLTDQLSTLADLSYQDLAVEIFQPFTETEISRQTLVDLVTKSYATFATDEITPMRYDGRLAILELFHGPTFAFKDIALQFLGNLFQEILSRQDKHLNILGATSGDTGSAAIYGVRGQEKINIFMIHPAGKISPIQEKQMTTVLDKNVYNLAIEGTFDDAQKTVKEIFNDLAFRDRYHLGAVNSINWARVMAQIVYYFYAALRYIRKFHVENVSFSVPTGNFGDIYAGYLAKQMGLPVDKLILATNENDILYRAIKTGNYKVNCVQPTLSPSMDIQIASNFERFVFDVSGRSGSATAAKIKRLEENGEFSLTEAEKSQAQSYFYPVRVDTQQTLDVMRAYQKRGIELDPHSAVGVAAAEKSGTDHVISLATAHPAKFGDAVKQATGMLPTVPDALQGIVTRESRCYSLPNDYKEVQRFISSSLSS